MLEVIHKIGKGSSGFVYKAQDKKTKTIYALKQSSSLENDELIKKEISIYRLFKNGSPYIIKYYDCFKAKNEHNKKCLYLQLEYCHFGSIREIIKHGRKKNVEITENEISSIIYMVLQGIKFIHSKNLIDRDIKGRNILVNNDGDVKLCDFGICRQYVKNKMKDLRGGSPYWMAPEILRKEEYDQNIDIWALGITCIELAEYEPPYSKLSPNEVIKQIIKSPPKGLSNPSKWSKEFNSFISECLQIDRFKRPLSDELLKHDFITMIDKKNLNRKLIILQFLSRCGYKVIYNKKTKLIVPPTNILKSNRTIYNKKNETVCNFLFKKLNHKSSLDNLSNINNLNSISSNKNSMTNINTGSSLNINTNNTSNYNINNLSKNKQNDLSIRQRISMKCSSIFNKKVYLRTRSVERENKCLKNNFVNYNYMPCLTSGNDNTIKLTPGLRNLNNKSNANIKNELLNDKNDDTINEEDELFDREKIYDIEIKNLMKERDNEINNIILKYQDKISQMKHDKNIYLKKSLRLNESGVKNKLDEKSKNRAKKNGIYSYKKKVNNSCSLNKMKTGVDDEKSKKLYLIID